MRHGVAVEAPRHLQAKLPCSDLQLRSGPDIELSGRALDQNTNRRPGEPELVGDELFGVSQRHQANDLGLPRRQGLRAIREHVSNCDDVPSSVAVEAVDQRPACAEQRRPALDGVGITSSLASASVIDSLAGRAQKHACRLLRSWAVGVQDPPARIQDRLALESHGGQRAMRPESYRYGAPDPFPESVIGKFLRPFSWVQWPGDDHPSPGWVAGVQSESLSE